MPPKSYKCVIVAFQTDIHYSFYAQGSMNAVVAHALALVYRIFIFMLVPWN